MNNILEAHAKSLNAIADTVFKPKPVSPEIIEKNLIASTLAVRMARAGLYNEQEDDILLHAIRIIQELDKSAIERMKQMEEDKNGKAKL